MTKHWTDKLVDLRAREEAVAWARSYDSLDVAWAACERGDWMLWLAGKLAGSPESDSRKKLVLAACACARTALPFVRPGETRPLRAIETTEQWARGENGVTLEQVRADAYAAAAAAAAAAHAAAAAAAAAHAADARKKAFKECADIMRTHYPVAPELVRIP